ncbi:MAG TPA: radical SAM protein [Burkholderiales bacterium]|nr:radical SAM protein [Burkholderiales bacterium]
MKVGVISVFTDYHRRGRHLRGPLQPQIGPLVAALLPPDVEIEVVNDTWDDPDWSRDYDLVLVSALHSDFDRARQISHYWRRRGAKTVIGGPLASAYPQLCQPFFDAVVVGDPESTVPRIHADFAAGRLAPLYRAGPYDPDAVPTPRFDLAAGRQIFPLAFEATRGCPFTCEFCTLTGLGTRFHTRAVARVVRDIRAGQRMLRGKSAFWQRRAVGFMDNNIGGGRAWLRELCDALAPLGVRWASCITFNVLRDEAMLDRLSASGCRLVYVGLESFNPAALADMQKRQNVVGDVRRVVDACRSRGILVTAGLMLDPRVDTVEYVERIPEYLAESGLHVPTYIAFETPIPGTPHFRRLAAGGERALLPNALLRDFTGYTLVTEPRHATPEAFVAAYRRAHGRAFSPATRARKLLDDLARLLPRGYLAPALADLGQVLGFPPALAPNRTPIAGFDEAPPETVPLTDADFASVAERAAIMTPWAVTDADARVLPHWLDARPVYLPKGRVARPLGAGEPTDEAPWSPAPLPAPA